MNPPKLLLPAIVLSTLAILGVASHAAGLTGANSVTLEGAGDDVGLNVQPRDAEASPSLDPAVPSPSRPEHDPTPARWDQPRTTASTLPAADVGAEDVTKPNSRDPCGSAGPVVSPLGEAFPGREVVVDAWDRSPLRSAHRACTTKSLTWVRHVPSAAPVVDASSVPPVDATTVATDVNTPVEPWHPTVPQPASPQPTDSPEPAPSSGSTSVSTRTGAVAGEGIPRSTTWMLVASLPLLPLASHIMARLARREVLQNPTRRAVMEHVRSSPGITAATLARNLQVHYETARYHLDVLMEVGLVTREELGTRVRYFENKARVDEVTRTVARALHTDGKRDVLLAIARSGALPSGEVAERVELAASTTSYHLRNLHDDGLVERRKVGRRVLYSLKPAVVPNVVELSNATPQAT